ncbi:putative zn 2cys6 transcription factor protein [Botrytis fragariae]|uniref:Putative zn 2cys6 transcription factor protein n=1 Tax=Botrytis fragariae TaxID=1964551 RepID=A0A8H6EJJ2_9HELO|nr:putative zn 2cys6 transcription factor protein [Botrytis fragariae]KAF5874200.1 putative zn 2cys6 transcription factor protein [Botrytis fragariae]
MDESPKDSTVTPKISKHGKACVNCARAKVKCVEKNDVAACERCHRLTKDCQPITRTKRRKSVKRTAATRTAELEQKLDGLVSLLTAATQDQNTPPSSTISDHTVSSDPRDDTQGYKYQNGSNVGNPPVRGLAAIDLKLPANSSYSLNSIPVHPPLPGPEVGRSLRDKSGDYCATNIPTATSPTSLIPTGLALSPIEEENALYYFRTNSIRYLPFIVISPDTNVHKFKKENPFWWLAIVMATAKSTSRQIALGMHIRQLLGQKLLISGERNLDLLWGLLTYIAWSQCHYQQRPVWSSMIQLAMGIAFDLGLNKAPQKEAPHLLLNFDARGCPKPFISTVGSQQEKRALLCLYSLSSSFSLYVQKIDTLRWTPYADECLKILSEKPESLPDTLMTQIVRLQLIQERVKDAPWYDTAGDESIAFKTPAIFYLKALKNQMETFRQQIPNEARENCTFLMHLYNTELTIHEVALSKEPHADMPDSQRLESLCICFQSVKSWFELYFSTPCRDHTSFSFPIYTHMAHCMVALYRLSVFEDPQWDVHLVRQQLDLSFILGQIVKTWENVKGEAGLDTGLTRVDDVDIYTSNAKRIGLIKTWWDAKVAGEASSNVSSDKFANVNGSENGNGNLSTEPVHQTQGQGFELPTFNMDMGQDLWDDGWWQDVFGAWGAQCDI